VAVDAETTVGEKPPVDPGCLPPWGVGELPAPKPFRWRNILALIGPGIVLVGSSLGTGEWVMGPASSALYKGALLWVVPFAIWAQAMLNTEAMRYTLLTGEPIFTGFMRGKPGPRFWLIWYLLLDSLSWWPALAGLAAQILLFAMFGSMSAADPKAHAGHVMAVNSGILILCFVLLCFGGKIYNTLEWLLSGKVFYALGYTLFIALFFVPTSVWGRLTFGMVNPFLQAPPDASGHRLDTDWALVAALAGYAGVGGLGNILSSNFVREKGWGMGAKVGAIPSAFGGQEITLSHLGVMARNTPEARERFRAWWRNIQVDQWGIWVWGSLFGMLLPCLIGAEFLTGDYIHGTSQWQAAAQLAIDVGARKGQLFTTLTLICGFVILFPGQLGTMDAIARRWCDACWSGSRRVRAMSTDKVKYIYYAFTGAYTVAGCLLVLLGISPPKMMVLSGIFANLALLSTLIHTLWVNTHFLPKEFQPPMPKRVAMMVGAVFYTGILSLVLNQTIQKAIAGTLFK
jgi:hypothetical protein